MSNESNTEENSEELNNKLPSSLLNQIENCQVRKYIEGPVFDSPQLSIFAPYETKESFTSTIKRFFAPVKLATPYLDDTTYGTIILSIVWEPRAYLTKLENELDVIAKSTIARKVILFAGLETEKDECANLQKIGCVFTKWPHWDKVLVLTSPNSKILNPLQIQILDHLDEEFDSYLAKQIEICTPLASLKY